MKRERALKIAAFSLILAFVFCVNALAESYYVGSINSDKYHYPSCSAAQNIKPENLVFFRSTQEAREAGYIPCKLCKPPYWGYIPSTAPAGSLWSQWDKPAVTSYEDWPPENAVQHQYNNILTDTAAANPSSRTYADPNKIHSGLDSTDPRLTVPEQAPIPISSMVASPPPPAPNEEGFLSEAETADYLAKINNYDIESARAMGYTNSEIIDYLIKKQ
jgi:hypothetical protein